MLPRQLRLDVRAADLYHYIAAGGPEVAHYQRIDATVHNATTFRLLQAELRNGKGGKNPADLQPFSRSLYFLSSNKYKLGVGCCRQEQRMPAGQVGPFPDSNSTSLYAFPLFQDL